MINKLLNENKSIFKYEYREGINSLYFIGQFIKNGSSLSVEKDEIYFLREIGVPFPVSSTLLIESEELEEDIIFREKDGYILIFSSFMDESFVRKSIKNYQLKNL